MSVTNLKLTGGHLVGGMTAFLVWSCGAANHSANVQSLERRMDSSHCTSEEDCAEVLGDAKDLLRECLEMKNSSFYKRASCDTEQQLVARADAANRRYQRPTPVSAAPRREERADVPWAVDDSDQDRGRTKNHSASSEPSPTPPDANLPPPTLEELLGMLPLEANAINLTRIQQFTSAYARYDARPNSPARKAASDAAQIVQVLQRDLMNNAYSSVNLTQNAQFTSQTLKGGFRSMMDFCDNLRQLLAVTSSMLGDLEASYGQDLTSDDKSRIRQQTEQFTRDNMASVGRWQRATERLLDPRR